LDLGGSKALQWAVGPQRTPKSPVWSRSSQKRALAETIEILKGCEHRELSPVYDNFAFLELSGNSRNILDTLPSWLDLNIVECR